MENYISWFLLALILVVLEMVTGTFYMLVIAIALAVGGMMALLGMNLAWQLILRALTVVTGTVVLRHGKSAQTSAASNTSFDIGEPVRVIKWNDNGTARGFYRGAEWDAQLESADKPRDATLYIAEIRGSGLVLTHRKSQQQ